ncbi:MAG TPA: hypothetical protein VMW72_17730 [Sedimentisphaerales bacterium]|nr:hypothetical protein [Sedimentisphaerales bacterium]
MNDENQENLKELFEKFLDAEQAERNVEDIQKAEEILREHPAPEPDAMLIANIKAEIAMRLPARRAYVFKHITYKAACAAAAVMFLTAIGLNLFQKSPRKPNGMQLTSIIPTAIWDSDDIAAADADLAIFTTEIEQIEDELLTLQSGEDEGNGDSTITELEMELIEINNSDFWKG